MKQTTFRLFFTLSLVACLSAMGQVGIGTDDPRGALDIASTTQGLVYPVVSLSRTDTETLINPSGAANIEHGTTIFNNVTVDNGIYSVYPGMYTWDGLEWVPQFNKRDYKLFEQSADLRTGSHDGVYGVLGDQTITFSDNTFVPRNYGRYKILVTVHYAAGAVDPQGGPLYVNFAGNRGDFDFTFNGTTTTRSLSSYSGYNNDKMFNGGSALIFDNQYKQTTFSMIEDLDRGVNYPFTLTFNQEYSDGIKTDGDGPVSADGRGYININGAVKCTVEMVYVGK